MSLIRADARSLPIADGVVNCCVTSPPYFGLRDYGTATWDGGDPDCAHTGRLKPQRDTHGQGVSKGRFSDTRGTQPAKRATTIPVREVCRCGARRIDRQIGVEASPDAYVAALVAVFREVRRVLTDDGTCWVNLGDSHNNSDKWGGGSSSVGKHKRLGGEQPSAGVRRRWRGIEGTKSKDLLMIPAIVALALRTDGWYLRSDIIWAKPNPMPESVTDRPTKSHEHLFLLTKSAKYYYDAKAISEPCAGLNLHDITGSSYVAPGQTPHTGTRRSGNTTRVLGNERGRPSSHLGASIPWEGTTRNKRDVWTVPTQPYMGAHFATMPEALVEPCILAGAPIGGLVLDPFCGSGTVLAVAERLSRRSVGTDLNYQGLAAERIAQRGLMFEEAVS